MNHLYIKDFEKTWEEIEKSPEYKEAIKYQDKESEGYKRNMALLKEEIKEQPMDKEEIEFWQIRLRRFLDNKEMRKIIYGILRDEEKNDTRA